MVTAVLSLREDYWEEYELEDQDISYLYDYLLENGVFDSQRLSSLGGCTIL